MKKPWVVATACAALFAFPALAQEQPRQRGQGHYERGNQPAPAQPAPAQPAPAPRVQPQAQAAPQGRGDFGRRDNGPVQAPQAQNNNRNDRGNNDRGNDRFARPDQNRDFRDNRAFGNNGRADNAPPDNGRRDFRQFNRVYNAPRRFRAPAYRPPQGFYVRRWSFGERLPPSFWARDYWLLDYYDFALPPPPPGTLWVRVGSDALLIDRFDGEIIEVVYNVFF